MRKSKQKDLILRIIEESHEHPNAFDIYQISQKTIPNISLGTVYRNLNTLLEEEKIICIQTPDHMMHYDNTKKKHAHCICLKCQHIFDIDKTLTDKEVMMKDFKVLDYNISFKGICEKCQNIKGE